MKASIVKQLKDKLESIEKTRVDFVVKNIPRLHRLLMEKFPKMVKYFNYALMDEKNEPTKLTLLRNGKIIAKNF